MPKKPIDLSKFRRVSREENEAAWKARKRTTAAPGKWSVESETITQRQYQETGYGGKRIETHIEEQRPYRSPQREAQLFRQNQSRKIRQELEQNKRVDFSGDIFKDRSLINKFKAEGFDGLSDVEQTAFSQLFKNYNPDLVRKWLGSSQKSRSDRLDWDRHVKKTFGSKLGPRTSRDYRAA
jgi:hypothetical protein